MHPQCQPASTCPVPSLFSPPQPPPRATQGRAYSLACGLSCRQEQAQALVATRKSHGSAGASTPGQQDSLLLRAAGVCWTREETCTELLLCQETLNPGPGISRAKPSQMSTCLSGLRSSSGLLLKPFLRGLLLSAKYADGKSPPLPFLGQNKIWKLQIPSRWLKRGIPSLTSPSLHVHAQLFQLD